MEIVKITKDNFETEVVGSDKVVLIDFWAIWCGPCKMLSPIIEEVAREADDIKVCKVNVDEEPELTAKFGIVSIPTLIVMRDGKIVNQSVGYMEKAQIIDLVRRS